MHHANPSTASAARTATPSSTPDPIGGPDFWALEPGVTFLNHGAFGSCPRQVLEHQHNLQLRIERQPVRFFVDEYEALWDGARTDLARFLGARAENLVFLRNTTEGINILLRAFPLRPDDEILVTNHAYNACRNAVDRTAAERNARVRVASIPFPLPRPETAVECILAAVTERTRLALLDHVTSPTGLVFPLETLIPELRRRGVEVIVDGAHAPGLIPTRLDALDCLGYAGNCHKWLCAPKGAAFLHVRPDFQARVQPLITSHGANSMRTDRSRYLLEFAWMGTMDPTAWLCVPEAIRQVGSLLPGGWPAIQQRNRTLALEIRNRLCELFEIPPPAPDSMLAAMAAIPLPPDRQGEIGRIRNGLDPLRDHLWQRHRIEVPVFPWPQPPARVLRVSLHLYNTPEDGHRLLAALREWRENACPS